MYFDGLDFLYMIDCRRNVPFICYLLVQKSDHLAFFMPLQPIPQQAKKLAIQQEQQRLKEEAARQQAAVEINDDELLSHVDSDIAQSTPDAMQPLASLMIDANGD